jgi:hypothetical protein
MSTTTNIACHDCKKMVWVGQSDYLYTSPARISELTKFLFEHKGHALEFVDSHDSKTQYYAEVDDNELQ